MIAVTSIYRKPVSYVVGLAGKLPYLNLGIGRLESLLHGLQQPQSKWTWLTTE
jgi:hypothetical protein